MIFFHNLPKVTWHSTENNGPYWIVLNWEMKLKFVMVKEEKDETPPKTSINEIVKSLWKQPYVEN